VILIIKSDVVTSSDFVMTPWPWGNGDTWLPRCSDTIWCDTAIHYGDTNRYMTWYLLIP